MNKTFLTGVDETHEYLLKWWYKNITKHNPDTHITICDFGMSEKVKRWAKSNADSFLEYEKHSKSAWFHKTQALIDSEYDYTCWIDVDCEVLKPIEDIFNYSEKDKIGFTVDVAREIQQEGTWWATGVNLINGKSQLLSDWHDVLKQEKVRGDQEALHELISESPERSSDIVVIPIEYQWLRLQINRGMDSPDKRIIHWTGPVGKQIIRDEKMNEDDFNFNT